MLLLLLLLFLGFLRMLLYVMETVFDILLRKSKNRHVRQLS